jgi:hypothetical protein
LKRKILFVMIISTLLLCSRSLPAQEPEKTENNFEIEFNPGFHWTNWTDYKGKIGEYEALEQGIHPDCSFSIKGPVKSNFIELKGNYYEDTDYFVSADIDLKRMFQEEFYYFRMPHYLEHDPLKNLNAYFHDSAGSPTEPVTEYTDLNPGDEYMIRYSTVKSKTTYRLPFLPGSEVFFDYRKEQRQGHSQAIAMSKCSSCHVVSQSCEINEYTEDLNPGFKAKFGNEKSGWLTVSYDYLKRRFGETGADPTNLYDPAVHPASGHDVFTNRVQYDNAHLPFNVIPSSEKDSHTVKAHGQLPQIATDVFASYVNSSVENVHEGNKYDLNSAIGRVTNSLIPGLTVSGKFRWMDIDNDDYFVHVTERSVADPVGPPAVPLAYQGTYSQAYLFDPEFYRESAMNRRVYETEISAKYRLLKHLTLNGGFEWRSTDRDYYEVDSGETTTNEYIGRVGLTFRKARLYGNINYEHQSISDPFANLKAACNPSGINPTTGNPFTGLQYFQLYDMRKQTLSNLPDRKDQISTSITWSASPTISVSGYYRYINESNDFGWDQQSHMPSASLWFAPSPKLNFTLSYLYDYQKTNSLICESVFNG